MILEAVTRFSIRHGITAIEWLQAILLTLWSLIIVDARRDNAPKIGLYGELVSLMPWWLWVAYGMTIVLFIAAGAMLKSKRLLYCSIFGKVTYWTTMAIVVYIISSTLLVPSIIFAFSVSAMVRYGELKYEGRREVT